MKILTISGSARQNSQNVQFLAAFPSLFPQFDFTHDSSLKELPLFTASIDRHPWPQKVLDWRFRMANCDALMIVSPEYLHNLPALIKNALEWLASSGEMMHKPVLPITFTPHPPRGEKAMQSLLWSLQALEARIVGQLDLYQQDIHFEDGQMRMGQESLEMLEASLVLLTGS
ncbi:MAG: NADPH-dependent FMN reductase [Bacteroidota bacterium]